MDRPLQAIGGFIMSDRSVASEHSLKKQVWCHYRRVRRVLRLVIPSK